MSRTAEVITPAATTGSTRSAAGVRARSRLRREGRRSNVLTVVMWLCALYFLLPLIWLVISSTKDNSDLFGTFGYWFGKFNLVANVESLSTYQGGIFWHWLINTVVYAVTSAVLA